MDATLKDRKTFIFETKKLKPKVQTRLFGKWRHVNKKYFSALRGFPTEVTPLNLNVCDNTTTNDSWREGEKEMGYWEKGDTKAHINKVHAPKAKENT